LLENVAFLTMEQKKQTKTIKLHEAFDSFEEFQQTLNSYCEETFQVVTVIDSHKLKVARVEDVHLIHRFKYHDIQYACIHHGSPKKTQTRKAQSVRRCR
jgi:hypothetical protein